ncbi:Alpha/beta hydrolase fold-3 - like 10 [Theobroma cacao]|nr:Alpha/beta hydrolase fold-3 - like 10 [Theobroma cacao]
MESTTSEIAIDCAPLLRVYKDGRVERLLGTQTVPPGLDPKTNVESKDVVFSQETGQYVRLYIPKAIRSSSQKLPLLVRAPEHPIPVAYDDSWAALKWVASHFGGNGPEEWLNCHADFDKVYLSGDSAGANIAHHIAIKIGKEKLDGVNLAGIVLAHPYFWGKEPVGDEIKDPAVRAKLEQIWRLASPTTSGSDDPWINPVDDQSLESLGCTRVLVCVAEKDLLRHRGWYYYEKLKKSGWGGEAEIMEAQGEEHVFHLAKPTCENAVAKLNKVAAFMNQDKA